MDVTFLALTELGSRQDRLRFESRFVCMAQYINPATANAITSDPLVRRGISYLLKAVESIELESDKN